MRGLQGGLMGEWSVGGGVRCGCECGGGEGWSVCVAGWVGGREVRIIYFYFIFVLCVNFRNVLFLICFIFRKGFR